MCFKPLSHQGKQCFTVQVGALWGAPPQYPTSIISYLSFLAAPIVSPLSLLPLLLPSYQPTSAPPAPVSSFPTFPTLAASSQEKVWLNCMVAAGTRLGPVAWWPPALGGIQFPPALVGGCQCKASQSHCHRAKWGSSQNKSSTEQQLFDVPEECSGLDETKQNKLNWDSCC